MSFLSPIRGRAMSFLLTVLRATSVLFVVRLVLRSVLVEVELQVGLSAVCGNDWL